MPVPSSLHAEAQRLLPGERIDFLFPAVIRSSPVGNVLVAVTPSSIVVLTTGFFGRTRPKSVLARLPHTSVISRIDLHGVPSFVLDGIRYEVDDEYLAVVNAVAHALDAERAGHDALPPDPLPDL